MLLEKLARAIACKHCENPSKLYELQIHADEQAREILRLNHVLDEVKKEREAARAAVVSWQARCDGREGEGLRYNCHLWAPKEPEHDD